MSSLLRKVWRHVWVGLLFAHMALVALQAMPSPGSGLNRRDWSQPTVQGEFDAWAGRLQAVGFEVDSPTLQDRVYDFAKGYATIHRAMIDPFKPYYRYCGTWQSWRMFVAPHRYPSRLEIRIEIDGRWVVAYQARDPHATWLGPQLDHDRFRAALFRYGWGRKYPSVYRSFTQWVARRATVDFPEATRVQVRFESGRTPSPEEVRSGELPETRFTRETTLAIRAFR